MTTTATPEPGRRSIASVSRSQPYRGGKTTLCAGCGHNAISERIIDAFFEMGIDPQGRDQALRHRLLEQEPGVFPRLAHGFNTVHGRMPSVGTGAVLANRKLLAIGVSGDGDTGAIGIGQFVHLMRRNVPMIYIIEDNGCYGLTKGQFSPTADIGSKTKSGTPNELPADRHLLAGDRSGRVVRGAVVLRRQEAAAVDPEGRAQPSRHLHDRRAVAVRDLQRSRGLDQELRLRRRSTRSRSARSASCPTSTTSRSTTSRAPPPR